MAHTIRKRRAICVNTADDLIATSIDATDHIIYTLLMLSLVGLVEIGLGGVKVRLTQSSWIGVARAVGHIAVAVLALQEHFTILRIEGAYTRGGAGNTGF